MKQLRATVTLFLGKIHKKGGWKTTQLTVLEIANKPLQEEPFFRQPGFRGLCLFHSIEVNKNTFLYKVDQRKLWHFKFQDKQKEPSRFIFQGKLCSRPPKSQGLPFFL